MLFDLLFDFIGSLGPYIPFAVAVYVIRKMIARGRRQRQQQAAQNQQAVEQEQEQEQAQEGNTPWIQTLTQEDYGYDERAEEVPDMPDSEAAEQPVGIYTDAYTGAQHYKGFERREEPEAPEATEAYEYGVDADDDEQVEDAPPAEVRKPHKAATIENTEARRAHAIFASIQKRSPLGQAILWKEIIDRPLCERNHR